MDPVSDAQAKFARNMLGPQPGRNKKINDRLKRKMTIAERATGFTAEQLQERQRQLRRDYEGRHR